VSDASKLIDAQIAELTDWRGDMMARLRKIITANSAIGEEFKWNSPVFTSNGNVCSIGAFKDHVKLTFFKGAELTDPDKLFNTGFEAKQLRSIDLREGDPVDEAALKRLVSDAINLNK
jgi:hypothetical protein